MESDVIAEQIIELLGTKENIKDVTNCITRLRFYLKDESKVKTEELKQLDKVAGIMKRSGQFQVIIGVEAAHLCSLIKKNIGLV